MPVTSSGNPLQSCGSISIRLISLKLRFPAGYSLGLNHQSASISPSAPPALTSAPSPWPCPGGVSPLESRRILLACGAHRCWSRFLQHGAGRVAAVRRWRAGGRLRMSCWDVFPSAAVLYLTYMVSPNTKHLSNFTLLHAIGKHFANGRNMCLMQFSHRVA